MAEDLTNWLRQVVGEFGGCTGTLHQADEGAQWLLLLAQIGVPEVLHEKIARIPFGKGIAGVAAATRLPVELCNIQHDLGGVAKEDARQTGAAGSLAVPIFSAAGTRVVGTLGVGMASPHDFSDAEKQRLAARAAEIAASLEP